jgi:hypothetical protein
MVESKPANGDLIPDLKKLLNDEKSELGNGKASKPKAGRLNVPPPVKEGRDHKFKLDEGVFERLEIEAKRRKTTLAALVNDVLDRTLPVFEVTINVVKRPKSELRTDATAGE